MLSFFQFVCDKVGEWSEENFYADFKNIVGNNDSSKDVIWEYAVKCNQYKNYGIKSLSYEC